MQRFGPAAVWVEGSIFLRVEGKCELDANET